MQYSEDYLACPQSSEHTIVSVSIDLSGWLSQYSQSLIFLPCFLIKLSVSIIWHFCSFTVGGAGTSSWAQGRSLSNAQSTLLGHNLRRDSWRDLAHACDL